MGTRGVVVCLPLCGLLLSGVLTGLTYQVLLRLKVVDCPNQRSSHAKPTIRGGGLGVLLALGVTGAWLAWRTGSGMAWAWLGIALFLGGLSFLDDLSPLPVRVRLTGQGLAAGAGLWALRLHAPAMGLALGPSGGLLRGPVLGIALAGVLGVWLAGYANAFNFMDGIDGLAAGQAVLTGLGMALIAGLNSGRWDGVPVAVSLLLAASWGGFLPYNFPRAKMFMGDVGSVPLGFANALLVLWMAAGYGWHLLVPLLCLHLNFILDTGTTLVRRLLSGKPWYAAHREHYYQLLLRSGKTHAFVTGWEMALQVLTLLLALGSVLSSHWGMRAGCAAVVLGIWAGFFHYCQRQFDWSSASAPGESPAPAFDHAV